VQARSGRMPRACLSGHAALDEALLLFEQAKCDLVGADMTPPQAMPAPEKAKHSCEGEDEYD
jgi:hypothetical protein